MSLTCFTTWNLEGTIFWWLSYNSRAYDIAHGSNLAECAIHPLFIPSSRYSCDYHAEQSENTTSLTLRIKNVSLNNARTYRCSYRDSTSNFTNVCMLRMQISSTSTEWTTLLTTNVANQTIYSTDMAPVPSTANRSSIHVATQTNSYYSYFTPTPSPSQIVTNETNLSTAHVSTNASTSSTSLLTKLATNQTRSHISILTPTHSSGTVTVRSASSPLILTQLFY